MALPYGVNAQTLNLPAPTQLLNVSQNYSFPVLRGLKLDPKNPLNIEFIIDPGAQKAVNQEDAGLLIKYFLAALTIPRENLWVNLSPYESDRIIPGALSQTELGEDMLGQDYLLKQLAASLTYPENEIGKAYWNDLKNTQAFNKVWITADKAQVYEGKNVALITKSSLKALTEEDYLAMQKNNVGVDLRVDPKQDNGRTHRSAPTQAFKQIILPLINKDINQGKNFAQLRQIYNAVVLGLWFKNKFKDSFYRYYFNKETVSGIDTADKSSKDKIYALYVEAFKKGVYNYVKRERISQTVGQKITKRSYFSGGVVPTPDSLDVTTQNSARAGIADDRAVGVEVKLVPDGQAAGAVQVKPDSLESVDIDSFDKVFINPYECHLHPRVTGGSYREKSFDSVKNLAITLGSRMRVRRYLADISRFTIVASMYQDYGFAYPDQNYTTIAHYHLGEVILGRVAEHGNFSSEKELVEFVDRETAQVREFMAGFLKADAARSPRSSLLDVTEYGVPSLKKMGVIDRSRVFFFRRALAESNFASETVIAVNAVQAKAIWHAHHMPGGWRKLTRNERAMYYKNHDIRIDGHKVHLVHTGVLAVTTCTPEQIEAKRRCLKAAGLNDEQIQWLMDNGWVGIRSMLSKAVLAGVLTVTGSDAAMAARHHHKGNKATTHSTHVVKNGPKPVHLVLDAPYRPARQEMNPVPSRGGSDAAVPQPVATVDQPEDGGLINKRNLAVVGVAGALAAGLLAARKLRKVKKAEDRGYDELLQKLEDIEQRLNAVRTRIVGMPDGYPGRDKVDKEIGDLEVEKDDLDHLKWFAQYWKDYSKWADRPLTMRQLMVILEAHKMPGGYRDLADVQGNVDVRAETLEVVTAADGRQLVTTGTVSQNSVKALHMKRANVGLSDEQIWWIMQNGGAGKKEKVGGVTWNDTVIEKPGNSQNFYFENIPDLKDIKSMGFVINSITPNETIRQFLN